MEGKHTKAEGQAETRGEVRQKKYNLMTKKQSGFGEQLCFRFQDKAYDNVLTLQHALTG